MSQIVTKPASKIQTGIKGAIKSPARFLFSLIIGIGVGVAADLFLEYLARNHILQLADRHPTPPELDFIFGVWGGSIPNDDILLILISIFSLYFRKFVFTLGFTIGWFISSYYNLYDSLGIGRLPQ